MPDDVLLNKAATIERCVARAREEFAAAGWIETPLADRLQKMVGFRNIAVHDYQALLIPIVTEVITRHLDDFLAYSRAVLLRSGRQAG